VEKKDFLSREGNVVILHFEECKLKVPEGMEIEFNIPEHLPLPDFIIYSFVHEGQTILAAYFGNHPSGLKGEKEVIEQGQINGMEYECYKSKGSDKAVYYNFLISIPRPENKGWWPMYCHFWYSDLSEKEERIAIDIINSLKTFDEK
jgi:hypothetical protein